MTPELAYDMRLAQCVGMGDARATETFVREHYRAIFRFLVQLTQSVEDAEDLTQTTLLRAQKFIRQYGGRSSLRAWLHTIAYREYASWRRSRRWHLPLRDTDEAKGNLGESVVMSQWVRDALALLPEPQRVTIVLREVEQLSVEEIAVVTNVPTGTVKSRLFHARERLRRVLSDQIAGEVADAY